MNLNFRSASNDALFSLITFPYDSLAQISAMAQDSIGAENRGSTDAEPRHVREINFVFIVVLWSRKNVLV